MSYSDQQLRDAVDAVFNNFDADKSGYLDQNEVGNLINQALAHMNSGRKVSQQEVAQFIKAVDSSGDGRIQKPELFEIFKKVLNHWMIVKQTFSKRTIDCKNKQLSDKWATAYWSILVWISWFHEKQTELFSAVQQIKLSAIVNKIFGDFDTEAVVFVLILYERLWNEYF